MRSISAWLFGCALLAAIARPTAAQPTDEAGVVVTLAPGGDASAEQRESALRALERSIVDSDLQPLFVASLASTVGDRRVATCQESDCALRAAAKKNARAIAGVSVWQKGHSRMQTTLTITWRDLTDPEAEEQFTDIPLIGSLTIDEAVSSGVAKFLAYDDDSIAVTIDSDPQGAAATVDGKPLGKTPLEVKLKPGGHELTLMLDDRYQPARKAIIVAATSTRFEVPLERNIDLITPPGAVDSSASESNVLNPIVGTALMVVGAGLLTYGIYALSVDGDTRVTSEDGEQEWKIKNGTGMGATLLIAGGLAAGAGGVIFLTEPF